MNECLSLVACLKCGHVLSFGLVVHTLVHEIMRFYFELFATLNFGIDLV